MKRILIFLFSAVTCLTANAQFINVYKDGKLQNSYDATTYHVEFEPTNPQAVPTYLFEQGTVLKFSFKDNNEKAIEQTGNTAYVFAIENTGNNIYIVKEKFITGTNTSDVSFTVSNISETGNEGVLKLLIEGALGYSFNVALEIDANNNTYTVFKSSGTEDGSDRFSDFNLKMKEVDITDLLVYKKYVSANE